MTEKTNFALEKAKASQKNVIIAYLLWWFLGWLGIHRLYSEQPKWWLYIVLSVVGFVTSFIFIGFIILAGLVIWWIIDAINLHKVIQLYNVNIIEKLEAEQLSQ